MTIERAPQIAVAIMAKAPISGEAKTRLGTTIGHPNAAVLYRAFLVDTVDVLDRAASRLPIRWKILVCPDQRHQSILRPLVDPSWSIVAQKRHGLMGGIVDGFESAFTQGADVTVVTDADSPLTLHEHVDRCLELGSLHDVALGPTADGGYYLVTGRRGARSHLSDLFLGTTFASSTICAMTAGRARSLSLTVGMGPTGFDVDTQDDLRALAHRLQPYPGYVLPRTRAALNVVDNIFSVTTPAT